MVKIDIQFTFVIMRLFLHYILYYTIRQCMNFEKCTWLACGS